MPVFPCLAKMASYPRSCARIVEDGALLCLVKYVEYHDNQIGLIEAKALPRNGVSNCSFTAIGLLRAIRMADHFVRTKPFDLLASCVTGSPCANCNVTLSCSTTARTIFGWQSTHEYLGPASLNDSTVI
ncbi:unnamed protein product [Peronospora belbahrii]|uniref:Uncharacterized protein n=1 Tax=Peronospora belbahrii TaxID=622444 RepID=A0ABN8CVF6_9STRA|nr:unnamed protein product [Peronospora belbahrii]